VTEGIVATSFPELTKEEWLSKLMKENENFDFTIYMTPNSQRPTEIYLAGQLKQVEKELHALIQKGLEEEDLAKSLAERKRELSQKLDYLRKGKYKLFKMALYILSNGVNEETAKKVSKKVMSALHSGGIEGKFATNYQKYLFMSMIPTGIDRLEGRRIVVPSTTAAASFPFRKR
jgi:type IV secretory pathway VirB4 component